MTETPLRDNLKARGLYPHQVDFVEKALVIGPGARILLADEAGLGKSVACAALIGELAARKNGAGHFLVIAPTGLVMRWRDHFREFGRVDPLVVSVQAYRRLQATMSATENPWLGPALVVTGLDFAKHASRIQELAEVAWDVVVVDEVHLCKAGTQRGRLLEAVWSAPTIKMVIAVSATPHTGRLEDSIPLTDPRTKMFRRNRSELKDWNGRLLFGERPERVVETVPVTRSDAERAFVSRLLTELMTHGQDSSQDTFFKNVVLRRLGSSLFAVEETLRRRIAILQSSEMEAVALEADRISADEDDVTSSGQIRSRVLSSETCQELLVLLERIEQDSKWNVCRGLLAKTFAEGAGAAVVFTDFADTGTYLRSVCGESGWNTEVITGRDTLEERQGSEERFRAMGGVLVLTSAGSKAIDLGFVKHVIHYDIPWSPVSLYVRFTRFERFNAPPGLVRHYFLIDEMVTHSWMVSKLLQLQDIGPIAGLPAEES